MMDEIKHFNDLLFTYIINMLFSNILAKLGKYQPPPLCPRPTLGGGEEAENRGSPPFMASAPPVFREYNFNRI
jgi:hypothetical protein